MSRSSTTGAYTRVDNSFSNPVVGTTISPTDADTFFDDVEASMNSFLGTSTTSLAIATGAKTFTIASAASTKVFLANTQIHAFSLSNTANYMDCTVTSYTPGTGALVTDCFAIGGSGTITDWVIISAGARGATGATGTTGPTSGIRQTYSSTTADADPGAGTFRLNNATPASATAAYLDNVDAGGSTVSGIFDLWDDSTTTTKGFVRFEKSSDPTIWAQFSVTGSVVDGTGYRKLTLSSGSGSGAFTNGDTFSISFFRSGDAGTNGAVAVSGTPTVNQFANWVDATTVKGTSITGLVKGNGASAPAAAVAGTDYCAATSGSTVLKGSSGNTTAATAGTDFVRPDTASSFTAQQYFALATITDAANLAWTVSTGQKAKVTLGGNRTMNAVTGAVEGATYSLWVVQDATGSRTISWTTTGAGSFDFGAAGAPTLTTTASKADLLTFEAFSIGGTLKLRFSGIMRAFT